MNFLTCVSLHPCIDACPLNDMGRSSAMENASPINTERCWLKCTQWTKYQIYNHIGIHILIYFKHLKYMHRNLKFYDITPKYNIIHLQPLLPNVVKTGQTRQFSSHVVYSDISAVEATNKLVWIYILAQLTSNLGWFAEFSSQNLCGLPNKHFRIIPYCAFNLCSVKISIGRRKITMMCSVWSCKM